MEGLYSGQCIYFQVPQRCQSCGPHQAKRKLAYEDSRQSTRLPEITNRTVKTESVTTNGKPKQNLKRNSTAKPPPKLKPKPKPKPKPKGHKNDSPPSSKPKKEETGGGTVKEEANLAQRLLAALQQTTREQNNQKKTPEAQTRAG